MRERLDALAFGAAVFVSGGVLLGLELAASRVVAPYFGSSLFVWGALIGVVLAGLSLGYWLGGALADRLPSPRLLVLVMALGAGLVLLVPVIDAPVLEAILRWDPGPRLDPLLASIVLFGPASVVLAATTPVVVRLRARSLATLGRTAGRLFAVSTAGSIAGTFVTAFWLVPVLGTEQLLVVGAGALFVAAGLVAGWERLPVLAVAGLAAAAGAGAYGSSLGDETGRVLSGAAAKNWSPLYRLRSDPSQSQPADDGMKIVYAKETSYHRLRVGDSGDERYLRFDSSYQSAMSLSDPFATEFRYTDLLQLGFAYEPGARDMLFVGLGGGSAPKRIWRDFPQVRIQAVEIDPVVVDVAYRYFRLPRSDRLAVAVEDGRRYLARTDRRWDLIAIDVFYADSIPFHMATLQFVQLLHERLRPGGVVLVNLIGALEGRESRLFRSIVRTYSAVFPTVLAHPVTSPGELHPESGTRNIVIVATDQPAPQPSFLLRRWRALRAARPSRPDLTRAIAARWNRFVPTADVPTLTDDYAPTDALLFVDTG
jgi:spermidine synthase